MHLKSSKFDRQSAEVSSLIAIRVVTRSTRSILHVRPVPGESPSNSRRRELVESSIFVRPEKQRPDRDAGQIFRDRYHCTKEDEIEAPADVALVSIGLTMLTYQSQDVLPPCANAEKKKGWRKNR